MREFVAQEKYDPQKYIPSNLRQRDKESLSSDACQFGSQIVLPERYKFGIDFIDAFVSKSDHGSKIRNRVTEQSIGLVNVRQSCLRDFLVVRLPLFLRLCLLFLHF